MESTSIKNSWDDQSKLRVLAVAAIILVVVACTQAYFLAKRPHFSEPPIVQAERKAATPLEAMPNLAVPDPVLMPAPQELITQMASMQSAMDQWFAERMRQTGSSNGPSAALLTVPKIDLRDEKDCYILRMDVPGADQASINVSIEGRILTVSGKREVFTDKNDGKLVRQERYSGMFERNMQLPGPVKAGDMEAKYDKGVLTVTLPKDTQSASKTIKIK